MVNWLLFFSEDENRTSDVFIPRSRTLKHRSQIYFPSNEADMIETKAWCDFDHESTPRTGSGSNCADSTDHMTLSASSSLEKKCQKKVCICEHDEKMLISPMPRKRKTHTRSWKHMVEEKDRIMIGCCCTLVEAIYPACMLVGQSTFLK